MNKVILILALVSNLTYAATSDFVKKGKCIATFPYDFVVAQKLDASHYLVGQGASAFNGIGAIEMKTHKPYSGEHLNIFVELLGIKTIKGQDGFDHAMDIWKECPDPRLSKK